MGDSIMAKASKNACDLKKASQEHRKKRLSGRKMPCSENTNPAARRIVQHVSSGGSTATAAIKQNIVAVRREEIDRLNRYVRTKGESAIDAQPSSEFVETRHFAAHADLLRRKLSEIAPGQADAAKYQQVVLEILNFLFNPELSDGELEVETTDGTERRDIIFANYSDSIFWTHARQEHSAPYVMFETKNTESIGAAALNQTATYLGGRLGGLGFIVTRVCPGEAALRKAFSIYNDSQQRKVILFLSDQYLLELLALKVAGKDTTWHIQKLYRTFRTSVQ